MRELIQRVKEAQRAETAEGAEEGAGEGGGAAALQRELVALLVKSWQILRTLRVCHEPGRPQGDGATVEKVAALEMGVCSHLVG